MHGNYFEHEGGHSSHLLSSGFKEAQRSAGARGGRGAGARLPNALDIETGSKKVVVGSQNLFLWDHLHDKNLDYRVLGLMDAKGYGLPWALCSGRAT